MQIMRSNGGRLLRSWKKLFMTNAGLVALALAFGGGILSTPPLEAQAPSLAGKPAAGEAVAVPQWQKDAGGKMAFDAASIKLDTSDAAPHSNFALDAGSDYAANGGLFSVTKSPLSAFIGFAYKLTPYQTQSLQAQLPKWAATDRFDVQARAQASVTKDQMRLMMQSILADRFKLTIHVETQQAPVYALVLVNPGKTGPQLKVHSDDPPCSNATPAAGKAPAARTAGGVAAACGALIGQIVSGHVHVLARDMTMGQIASYLVVAGRLDRPVLDQTGLSGNFDMSVEAPGVSPPPGSGIQADPSAPTFVEALRDELGLKLVPQTGTVEAPVIDHVEEPTPN